MFRLNVPMIRRLLAERRQSIRQFALASGLHEFTARKAVTDGATISMKTLGAIAQYFAVDADALIMKGDE